MDTYSTWLYNEINIISLFLLFVVLLKIAKNNDFKKKTPSCMGFVISLIVLAVDDFFWALLEGKILSFTVFRGYIVNIFYFGGTLASVYFLFMLFQDILGYRSGKAYLKKSLLIVIPFVIDLILVLLTPITHWIFFYEGETYYRAKFYTAAVCIPYTFVIYLCVSSFVKSFKLQYFTIRRALRIMTRYSLMTLFLSFFQLVTANNFPLYTVGGTMICLLVYIDKLNELNAIDQLTGLHSVRASENYLSDLIKKGCEPDKNIYLLLADVIDFKSINEIYGRDEGNHALREVSRILQTSVPTGWFAARFGGDEFSLLGICAPEEIDHICMQISTAFDEYNTTSRKPYKLTVSIGYAAYSYTCKSVNDFIKLAERHLDTARMQAKNGVNIHQNEKSAKAKAGNTSASANNSSAITQQDINLWMNDALKNNEFIPYFQPQIDSQTGTISGAEALVRWIHPDKGMIYPSIFIPVFERNGFIYEMDKAIWHSVCALMRQWKDEGRTMPPISVNVSRWDIVQSDFPSVILSYLGEFHLQTSDLHLEITESAYLFDQEYLMRLMEKLQSYGFEIEMDDFGTGYSSLTAFKDLPFNLIKLDSSLIRESTKTDKAKNILEGIVSLTKKLGIPLIAEGVEYKEQADFLKQIGCYNMQGYLFAKPMPPEKFTEFISEWNEK